MKEIRLLLTVLGAVGVLGLDRAQAQALPSSGLYEIISGRYVEKGGIYGVIQTSLPNAGQAFVRLTVEPMADQVELAILGTDLRPAFPGLTNGVVTGSTIRFEYLTVYPYWPGPPAPPAPAAAVDYTVTWDGDQLRLSGSITSATICCDFPYDFEHQSVVAAAPVTPTLRASEVELCWNSTTNNRYQVQYRSSLTTNQWTNLGDPVPGQSATTCVADKVAVGQPDRFYRVLTLPQGIRQ